MFETIRSWFRVRAHRRDFEDSMREELNFHVQQYKEELMLSGISEEEAARRARIEFGSRNRIEGDCREARGLHVFSEFFRQARYALRLFRKTPGFTVTALLTLAVCLGANLTIFAVIDSILLRPLPFPESDQLVTVFNTYPQAGVDRDGSSLTNYYERRGHIPAFASIAIYRFGTAIVGESGSTQREQITRISPDFFTTLGLGPIMGRSFKEAETSFEADNVVVITDGFWRHSLNGDPHIIGKQIRVDGNSTTVVGILPTGFRFLSSKAGLYLPRHQGPRIALRCSGIRGGMSRK